MRTKAKEILRKQHYALVGKHSGIQICRWTKKSLLDEGVCYKEKFYGIKSHRCCEMTPCFLCMNSCLHCWRAVELNLGNKLEKVDDAKFIVDECILAQRKMLTGFGGNLKVNREKFREAQNPKQFAISLSGEPTIYPKLAELVLELRKRKITSFIVTNGLLPEKILELKKKKALPTQLYVSLNYPNEKIFRKITRNKARNAWKKFNKTLELMKNLKTRTVVRINLVRDLNMNENLVPEYAKLIEKASPMAIEIKGYMSVGYARQRLGYERMPVHSEIVEFSRKLLKFLPGYKFLDEKQESRVVLLGKNTEKMIIKREEI
ncbi:MAG: 4-demethylwyosine synthase TYW1 [Nanoarchaeota archaeon]|nr:4-demethylwyosine synthase TYW1 [Nanoarchaeota archaeon]MBU4086526.1 4-demethylwyosine synthase TYW1 [Nanoarchaeota archaeon]